MRSRLVLPLVLVLACGVLAWQQYTKPPRYTGPPPAPPALPAAPVAAAPAVAAEPPDAEMTAIVQTLGGPDPEHVEARLRELHAQFPGSARVLASVARLEYSLAVAGRPQPIDKLHISFDQDHMNKARSLAEQAVAADPELAEAWLISARVALARTEVDKGMELLARAEALDPDSTRLRMIKGDGLRAQAAYTGDDAHLAPALEEYARILQPPIDSREEAIALRQMGETSALMGDTDKAVDYLTQAIGIFQGRDLAFALESRARIHLTAGDADTAIEDSVAALEVMPFPVAAHTLADAHLLKAGTAMKRGDEATAMRHLEVLLAYDPEPMSHVNRMASRATTFPAVYAMFAPAIHAALEAAAAFITAADLRKLASLGLRFDDADAATNALLFAAIGHDNVEAVSTLLKLGADTSARRDDGASLLDAARIGTQPARKEIRRLLLAKMGKPEGWTDTPVDLPKPGHWYQAERSIGVVEGPTNKAIDAGMVLLAGSPCSTPGRPFICFTFYTAPGAYYSTVLVPLSSPEDFNALREVEAPVP